MSASELGTTDLVRLFDSGSLTSLSEWELLKRFASHGDERAFEAVVSRHGPMVRSVCRRMLGDTADADDAFQATFLVLLRRVQSLGPDDLIPAWLHGVAVKVCRQARATTARRHGRERQGIVHDLAASATPSIDLEALGVLDEELNRLPWKYRVPIVLCFLEGQTHEQASRQLQWPLGSVKGRIARAKSLLESRLTRRGVSGGAVAVAALGGGRLAHAQLSSSLLNATCRAAFRVGGGAAVASVVPSTINSLVQGVVSAMIFQKLGLLAVGVGVSGALLASAIALAGPHGNGPGPLKTREEQPVAAPPAPTAPTPALATAAPPSEISSETVPAPTPGPNPNWLNQQLVEKSRHAYLSAKQRFDQGKGSSDRVYAMSRAVMAAESGNSQTQDQIVKAISGHIDRMTDLSRRQVRTDDQNDTEFYVVEANAMLAQAKQANAMLAQAKPEQAAPTTIDSGSDIDKNGLDRQSRAILTKLEQPVSMNFPNETPLEDVLKYIKQASQGPKDTGIPIYVDPLGLNQADKTMTSPVSLDLEGVPLKTTLKLLLRQLGLVYYVSDGFLVITSETTEMERLTPANKVPWRLLRKYEKAEQGELTEEEVEQLIAELQVRKQLMQAISELQKIEFNTPSKSAATDTELLKEIRDLLKDLKNQKEKQPGQQSQ